MRAKVGDAPRTMSQKILEAHLKEDSGDLDLVQVKVDQVVLSREPNRALGQAVSDGLTESQVEVNVAYPPRCVTMTDEDLDPLTGVANRRRFDQELRHHGSDQATVVIIDVDHIHQLHQLYGPDAADDQVADCA